MKLKIMNSPQISDKQIQQIHILAKKFQVPMTVIVRVAMSEFLVKHETLIRNDVMPTEKDINKLNKLKK